MVNSRMEEFEHHRLTTKVIDFLVNKVNATNIKNIIPELFDEDLIKLRGFFCHSVMKSQMATPETTDVFAALVAVVNAEYSVVGNLLLRRIVLVLKQAYNRRDKARLVGTLKFIAHLLNQRLLQVSIVLEVLILLLRDPSDYSVEAAVTFVAECGAFLQGRCPRGLDPVFERFHGILQEGKIGERVRFLVENLTALRKAKFQGYIAVRPASDLVEQNKQITHEISLLDEIDPEIELDVFRPSRLFLNNEKQDGDLKVRREGGKEYGLDSDKDLVDESDEPWMGIDDESDSYLFDLRREIYMAIMSSANSKQAGDKLLKIRLLPGQEMQLCRMLLECCSQEKIYEQDYGLLAQHFCMNNKVYQESFEKGFVQTYAMVHRLRTNQLHNVAKFFAHLLSTDALPWRVFTSIGLADEDISSSSRIFTKILFQELSGQLGFCGTQLGS